MLDQPWKDSKTVQFAVGATLILVFAWWMFTGDIPFLSEVAFSEAPKGEDGKVQAVEWLPVVWGMIAQACVIVGASAIGLFSGIWTAIVKAIQPKAVALDPAAVKADAPVESTESLIRNLAKAVATNNAESKAKYETQIRKPYATNELVSALEDGDFDTAEERYRELKALAGLKGKSA
jgi:hypothetical protein